MRLCLRVTLVFALSVCSKAVTVFPEDSEEGVLAYVYVRDSCGPIAIAVEGGDWVAADKVQLNGT